MVQHKIYVKRRRQEVGREFNIPLIRRCIRASLETEHVDIPCEVNVLITDDKGIRIINKEHRGIDKATDVLSFPLQNLRPGDFEAPADEISPETGRLPLGDIVISADRIRHQAHEYGHSRQREMSYLVVHATLHLLGYDHTDEGENKKEMRRQEEIILSDAGF